MEKFARQGCVNSQKRKKLLGNYKFLINIAVENDHLGYSIFHTYADYFFVTWRIAN
jgi:hypothetical protein